MVIPRVSAAHEQAPLGQSHDPLRPEPLRHCTRGVTPERSAWAGVKGCRLSGERVGLAPSTRPHGVSAARRSVGGPRVSVPDTWHKELAGVASEGQVAACQGVDQDAAPGMILSTPL